MRGRSLILASTALISCWSFSALSAEIIVNPGDSIESAVNSAASGDTVLVMPGNYNGGFTVSNSGVTVRSQVPGSAKISGGGGESAVRSTGNNVTIEGFDITCGSCRMGIYASGSSTTVRGNTVHGILTDSSVHASAKSSGNGGAGILVDSYGGGSYGTSSGSTITGNTVTDVGIGDTNGLIHGIYMTQPGSVTENLVRNVDSAGITAWHGASKILVQSNVIEGSGSGIYLGSGDSGANVAGAGTGFEVINNRVDSGVSIVGSGNEVGTNGANAPTADQVGASSVASGPTTPPPVVAQPNQPGAR